MKRAWSVVTVFLVVFMAACGGGGGSPDQAAKQWFDALGKGDENALKDLTCAAQHDSIGGITGLLGGLKGGIDFSSLSFKTTEQSDDTAGVQVTGKLKVTVLGQAVEEEIDEAMPLVKEDGKWKLCE
jgi:hypothetical protein